MKKNFYNFIFPLRIPNFFSAATNQQNSVRDVQLSQIQINACEAIQQASHNN